MPSILTVLFDQKEVGSLLNYGIPREMKQVFHVCITCLYCTKYMQFLIKYPGFSNLFQINLLTIKLKVY